MTTLGVARNPQLHFLPDVRDRLLMLSQLAIEVRLTATLSTVTYICMQKRQKSS